MTKKSKIIVGGLVAIVFSIALIISYFSTEMEGNYSAMIDDEKVEFQFSADHQVTEINDETSRPGGTYRVKGDRIVIKFKNRRFVGKLKRSKKSFTIKSATGSGLNQSDLSYRNLVVKHD